MKITRNTPQQLIVADVPWFIGISLIVFTLIFVGVGMSMLVGGELWGWIFALFGGGMGVLFFGIFVRRTQVIFDRGTNQLTMRTRSVLGYTENHRALSDVHYATLEYSTDSDGDMTYRPTLVMKLGAEDRRLPIVTIYTNTRGPERVVEAVNDWLGGAALDSNARRP